MQNLVAELRRILTSTISYPTRYKCNLNSDILKDEYRLDTYMITYWLVKLGIRDCGGMLLRTLLTKMNSRARHDIPRRNEFRK